MNDRSDQSADPDIIALARTIAQTPVEKIYAMAEATPIGSHLRSDLMCIAGLRRWAGMMSGNGLLTNTEIPISVCAGPKNFELRR